MDDGMEYLEYNQIFGVWMEVYVWSVYVSTVRASNL